MCRVWIPFGQLLEMLYSSNCGLVVSCLRNLSYGDNWWPLRCSGFKAKVGLSFYLKFGCKNQMTKDSIYPTDPFSRWIVTNRVIGVKNLRVVDASIMPRITNANICAPVVMIAEKASYEIISDYSKGTQESTSRKPPTPKPPLPLLQVLPLPTMPWESVALNLLESLRGFNKIWKEWDCFGLKKPIYSTA